MPNQFTIYKSSDASAPTLNGTAGSLLTVLDAILVNGYGSGGTAKAAAGWTKPFSNSGNVGCYQMGGGSQCCLSINDNGPNVTSTYKEARITGYETLSAVATGGGQFPNAAASQGVTPFGFVVARKSATADGTARAWICVADALTFYFHALTTDVASNYFCFAFGDFYSLAGSGDTWRCMIIGRAAENSNIAGNVDLLDRQNDISTFIGGMYLARTYSGGGSSITGSKHGDLAKTGATNTYFGGGSTGVASPNGPDNARYLSPVWISEPSGSQIRGRMRGFWHLCHYYSSYSDGQVLTGANEVAGKTFQILKFSANTGMLLYETSATLETN